MSEQEIDRKITVIFATDVVGYSKHMEEDENGTVKNLRACEKILTGLFEKHKGRLFNTGGDSFLAEFPSAVSAVECAVEFQKAIKERNSSDEASVKLKFRIGINSGDVIKEKDNLLGDGVNIAARLEALAQSGGITISKVIYDYVKSKTQYEFNDLGLQKIKQNEFHAFDLLLTQEHRRKLPKPKTSRKSLFFVLFLSIAACVVSLLWWNIKEGPSNSTPLSYAIPAIPSIAVLPFERLYEIAGNDYVTEGITQNLTNQLSQTPDLFVITYSSAKKITAELTNVDEIARSLGVRFILEGSVQRSGDDLRVNITLSDAMDQSTILTNKYDGKTDDLFMFQDRIATDIFANFKVKLAENLIGKNAAAFSSIEQMQKVLEFRENFLQFSRDGHLRARELAKEISNEYPDSGQAKVVLAWLKFQEIMMGLTDDKQQAILEGAQYAKEAHELLNDGMSLIIGAWMDLFANNPSEDARKKAARAIEIDQSGDVISGAANILLLTGDPTTAKQLFKRAMKVSPFYPVWYANRLAEAHIMLKEYDKAAIILSELVSKSQEDGVNLREKSRALVALSFIDAREGRANSATNRIKELKMINPNFSAKSIENYLGMVSDREFFQEFKDNAIKLGIPIE